MQELLLDNADSRGLDNLAVKALLLPSVAATVPALGASHLSLHAILLLLGLPDHGATLPWIGFDMDCLRTIGYRCVMGQCMLLPFY